MALSVSNLLLSISSEGLDEERRNLGELARDLAQVDGADAEAEVTVDTLEAITKLQRFRERLGEVDRERVSPEVNLQIADAIAKIAVLEARLKKVDGSKEIDVKLRRSLISQLGSIGRTVETVTKDVEGAAVGGVSALEKVGGVAVTVLGAVLTGVANAVSAIPVLGTTLAKPFELLASGGTAAIATLGPLGLLVIPILIGALFALGSALVAVGGALFALAASAAAAVAGLGAVAVAMAAAFGPVLLVGIALVTRLVAVMKALQQREQERAQAQQQVKTAHEQVTQASDSLKHAQQDLRDETVAGFQAMSDAADAYKHDLLSIDSARLGIKDARLELRLANNELAKFRRDKGLGGSQFDELFKKAKDVDFNPSSLKGLLGKSGASVMGSDELALEQLLLRRQHALLGIREANQRVSDSEKTLARDQRTNADFTERGLRAYKPYRDALDQVVKAKKAEAKASKDLRDAQAKLNAPLKGLTDGERKFAGVIESVGGALKKAFGPAVAAALGGVTNFLKSLVDALTDPRVQSGLTAIGEAIANFFTAFGQKLDTEQWRKSFADFANSAARMMGDGTEALLAFLDILRQIAGSAMPALESGARKVSAWLQRIAGDGHGIRTAVHTVISNFKTWLGIAGELSGIVRGFLRAAVGSGQQLAGHLRSILKNWNEWLNSKHGQTEMRRFFKDALDKVRDIKKGIQDWAPALRTALRIAEKIRDALQAASDLLHGRIAKAAEDLGVGSQKDFNAQKGKKDDPFLKRFLHGRLGFNTGGVVPGVGKSVFPGWPSKDDTVPAMLTPGEFVVQKAIVRAVGLPKLRAINAGIPPAAVFAGGGGAAAGGGRTPVHIEHVSIESHDGGYPDAQTALAHFTRLATELGI